MDSYFEHLMEDLRRSYAGLAANVAFEVHPVSIFPNSLPDQWQHAPFYPTRSIGEWMKLDPEAFPPADRWEERHLKELCSGLRQLFMEYRYEVVMPWTLPLAEEYTWLVTALSINDTCYAGDEDNWTIITLDICGQNPETCPFADDCLHRTDIGCESFDQSIGWEKYV